MRIVKKIDDACLGRKGRITILGWAFKKNTNDSRESSSIYISYELLKKGYNLNIYDPNVTDEKILNDINSINKSENYNIQNLQINFKYIIHLKSQLKKQMLF